MANGIKLKHLGSFLAAIGLLLQFYGCSTSQTPTKDGAPASFAIDGIPNANPKFEPRSRYGNPDCYCVEGKQYYVLKSAKGYCKTGLASWYGTKFHGRATSSREPYDMFAMTAASRTLPIPTYVEVINLENGHRIIAKVNDRGPFKSDRIIDLSYAAATKLGFANKGTANVQVRAIDAESLKNEGIEQNIILANNEKIPEIQINPVELPAPHQTPKPVTLDRYLQLGAFTSHDNAYTLQQKIIALTNATVRIKDVKLNDKTIYRVQIGPFKSEKESNSIQKTLSEQGITQIITVFS